MMYKKLISLAKYGGRGKQPPYNEIYNVFLT